ncbi:cytoglobin-1-like [Rhinatrema bivittatum]|uniref:cytoglobin-1-like n=1 Tax=Rhinatrema bivittatum TaxID=194408 RepID=UPI001129A791|nr:cytoglobin-1-like [Rhinatrema bivittatum]
MALSDVDVQSARGAWAKLYTNMEENGTRVLVRMFTEYPDTKSYFSHFKGIGSAAEMEQSAQVRGHGKKVFSALNDMIQCLDNTDAFSGMVNPLGKKHATQLKVDPKYFRVICDIISQLIEEQCGRDGRAAFEKVTTILCTQLNSAYKEVGW